MAPISRRDSRRPYVVTPAGIRRIVLGAAGEFVSTQSASFAAAHPAKPVRTNEAPRRHLLVLAYSDRGVLDEHARQALAAAALIADPQTAVIAAVLGDLNEDLAAAGADLVLTLRDCDVRDFRPEYLMAQVSALIDRYRPLHAFLPDRSGEGDLGRRLAATLGASIATRVIELDANHIARYHRSSKRLERRPLTDIVLLAPDAVDASLPFVGRGERAEAGPIPNPRLACRDGGLVLMDAAELPLEEADFVAAAGNGVADVALFERLAKALGATIGASRVAVDDGRFGRDKQVGATGKTVSANLYLAIGISGAVQHLQGIKDCRHVIAVNRDIAAPVLQRANLSVIDDAQAFMRALLDAIQAARAEKDSMKERAA